MNYSENLKNLQEYYANLLIVQYNGKSKAKASIESLVKLIYANMILQQIEYGFDWTSAVGQQLDIIGKWVGVSRSYNTNPITDKKLSYPQYSRLYPSVTTDSIQGGYSDYTTFGDNDGGQLIYPDLKSVDNQLNDDDYRVVIGLKIIYNSINHVAGEIDEAIWSYFGGDVYTTWTDHTITYNYTSDLLNIMQICEYKGVLPAPIGTEIQLRGI